MQSNLEEESKQTLYEVVFYVCLFLLFREWFDPLLIMLHLTEIWIKESFFAVLGLLILLDWFMWFPQFRRWILKICLMLLWVCTWFVQVSSHSFAWVGTLAQTWRADLQSIVSFQFTEVSSSLRALLFFVGCALFVQICVQWIKERETAVWFVCILIVYLLTLQYWPGLDTYSNIVRGVAIGGLFIILLHRSQVNIKVPWVRQAGHMMGAMILSLSIVGAGLWMAQYETRSVQPLVLDWEQMMHWNEALPTSARQSKKNELKRTGYGSDDTHLGGPNQIQEGIAFRAKSLFPTYWRGETKDYYDGKGWSVAERSVETITYVDQMKTMQENIETMRQDIWIEQLAVNKQLFLGGSGQIVHVHSMRSETEPIPDDSLVWHPNTGAYTLPLHAKPLKYYALDVATENTYPALGEIHSLTASEERKYLQLPSQLPQRVHALAADITANLHTHFEQARAIEQYLAEHYEYNLQQPTFPKAEQDFVDHFLFEEKVGYCDHFSTAMVVMLRSIGIPARWVKGFSPGAYDEGLGQYVVKFEDAHSWVEVHLPHTGWVRMEPTPSEGIRFAAGSVATNENNILSLKERIDRFVWGDSKQRMRLFMQLFGWLIFIGSLSGLLYLVAEWIVSSRARSCRWLQKQVAQQRWQRIVHHLERAYGRKEPSMTLREYVAKLKQNVADERTFQLVELAVYEYEMELYGE